MPELQDAKSKQTEATQAFVKLKESESGTKKYTFVGANTLPDRASGKSHDGTRVSGEILSKKVLDKFANYINDEKAMGGKYGSYRTVSLFHDRVYSQDMTLEEAGFVVPGSAKVHEIKNDPGNFELLVDVEVNEFYEPVTHPSYTPEKIKYKIEKGALGLSIEYNNDPNQERVVEYDGESYNYVLDTNDFRGFGFARANLIGNPGAVRVKEIELAGKLNSATTKKVGDKTMEAKIKELETQLAEHSAKLKELSEEKKAAEESGEESKAEEVSAKVEEVEEKVKEIKLGMDSFAAKIKESLELGFASAKFSTPAKVKEVVASAKVKEAYNAIEAKDFVKFKEIADAQVEKNFGKVKELMRRDSNGFDFERWQTVEVKCKGSSMVVVPSAKTKDVISSSDMAESTYTQTNAMFADRYVSMITETFLMDDTLLAAMPKIQHLGGNDKYGYRLWKEFVTTSGTNTLAVDPTVTSVLRSQRDFEKMETSIREYRDGVEVTDFVQAHSAAAIGNLLGLELERAAKAVTQSMAADLFKGNVDASGWLGLIGLIGVADSSTYSSMYGKVRSAANRLLDATLANTYDSTSEAISVSLVRQGYEKVLAQGSSLANLVIVIHPTQMRKLFDAEDAAIRYESGSNRITMGAAPANWGFSRAIVPHLDGIPMIRDYNCESSAAAADMFAVVDLSRDKGFNLVVSKALGARGLAKVGTSESAYVSFWGATVYHAPRNVHVHVSLT